MKKNYLNAEYGVLSWLLTKDHKRIAILYLATITLMFAIGGFYAMLIRLELLTPAGDDELRDYNRALRPRDHPGVLLLITRSRRCWELPHSMRSVPELAFQ